MQRLSARQRGYDSRWDRYRAKYLRAHPLCVRCQRAGRRVASSVVNHREPHRGDHKKFWDPKNHEAVCEHCHNSDIQRYEKSGKAQYRGCDEQGNPLDPKHHWRE